MATYENVDRYIASFPPEARGALERVRAIIHDAVPGAEEKISYGIAAFRVGGKGFVSLGGWKRYVSLYPVPEVEAALAEELAPYRAAKSTLRFPLSEPIPDRLVERVVRLLAAQRGGSS